MSIVTEPYLYCDGDAKECPLDSAANVDTEKHNITATQPVTTMWHERLKIENPNSDPDYWPNSLKVQYMEAEILDLRARLASESTITKEQESQIADAIFKTLRAYRMINEDAGATWPLLLMMLNERAGMAPTSPHQRKPLPVERNG